MEEIWNQAFTSAEKIGKEKMVEHFKNYFEMAKGNYKLLTSFVLFLNDRLWRTYEEGNYSISRIYNDLWDKACGWADTHLKGEEARYYFHETN